MVLTGERIQEEDFCDIVDEDQMTIVLTIVN